MPDANANTSGYIDWEARRAEQAANTPDRLEDNPLGRCLLDIERRRILQEELDRQAAASTLLDAPANAKGEALKDLEIDTNDLDLQRDEHQRPQEEADKKPAAKKGNPNDDEDKKMPAKEAKSNTKKPETKKETEIHEDKKMPASSQRPSTATPTATGTVATSSTPAATGTAAMSDILPSIEHLTEEETALISNHIIPWLSYNDIALNDDGTFYSDSTIPPLVQQWLISRGAMPAAAPTSVAASATPTQEATDDGIADRILPSLDDLFLPEEEQELISDHIIPWLDNNDFAC